MAFVDELHISARAGKGGDGVVRWRHEKGKEFSGPSGGNGGKGADVYFRGIRDIGKLSKYINKKSFLAENGENGKKSSMEGKNGEDLFIDVPIGSVITSLSTNNKIQILEENESVRVLKGGNGGLGNEHFKSSRNTRPDEWTAGKKGEEDKYYIELELIADVGFIGLPNAGKSSLLNMLTNADAKTASYEFTTLDPNLGDLYGYILADIPGLIEGASGGKGLGHKFLRHIKRTKFLAHCVSLENENILGTYKTIRKELEAYSPDLSEKKEIILLTKSDLVDEKTQELAQSQLEGEIHVVSIYDDASIKEFKDSLVKILREDK